MLCNILQEGRDGPLSPRSKNKPIAATTKNIRFVFRKLCGLASFELFSLHNEQVGAIYTEYEIEQIKEAVEVVREDQYLEDVFGARTSLDKEDWLEKMVNEAKWAFSSTQLRQRLLDVAGIVPRHF